MSDVDQGPSDDELLNDVLSDAETTDGRSQIEQLTEAKEELEAQAETTEEATTETTAEKPEVDDNAPQVPSWRLREINEEKRRVADENERLKAELANLRRNSQPQSQTAKPEEKDDGPDPLLDPKGYAKHVREEIRNELLAERREESMKAAHDADPAVFKAAYDASIQAMQNGDVSIRARMQNARDPGKELLKWHKEQKVKAEVGDDLEAFIEKKVQERIAAQARPDAQTHQSNGRPRTSLPPSLNGASRANTTLKSNNDDVSDDELFRQVAG